jgi:holo-[acyl-carrier protein] synthase
MGLVIGIGTDILKIQRIKKILKGPEGSGFLEKTFTKNELLLSKKHSDSTIFFATRFAGKEAIFKSFGVYWHLDDKLTDIEIIDGDFGEPIVKLSGRFKHISSNEGNYKILLSLSYENDYAIAFAVLVK